jgi:hypothetical protein
MTIATNRSKKNDNSENWNKAYVYLTPTVSSTYSAANYKIAWGTLNNTGAENISIFLDNIKIIHY